MSLTRIAQLERLDAQGQVLQAWDIRHWPVRLGRGLEQDIAWPDPHLAEHHLSLDVDVHGQLLLSAAATLNGVRVGKQPALASQPTALAPEAVWQAGDSYWRVRRVGDSVAAEAPLPDAQEAPVAQTTDARHAAGSHDTAVPWRTIGALGLATLAWEGTTLWLDQNPGTTWNTYLTPLLAAVAAITVWVLMWGLVSKLFTHRYTVWPHLRIVLMYLLASSVVESVAGLLAYALDMPALARWVGPVTLAVGAAMLAHHLRVVLPQHARRVNTAVAAMTVAALGVAGALNLQRIDRLMPYQHLSTLPPPALRLASPQAVPALLDQLKSLEAPLQGAAQRAKQEDDPSLDDLD